MLNNIAALIFTSYFQSQLEVVKLREECERLHSDRRLLKERVAFSYPEKYRSFVMFEELLKKGNYNITSSHLINANADDEPKFVVPEGTSETEYLKSEETKLLNDIFTLVWERVCRWVF